MSTSYYEEAGESELDEGGRSLADYLDIVKRRWQAISIGAAVVFLIAALLAALLPPSYRSSATILIQEQEIPQELVRSTITSFADERIQVISQQVLARSVLLELIEKYDLYANRRRFQTNEEVIDRMRADIKVQPVSAEVMDRRTGSQVKATIAFKLSYESGSAANAQKIANDLATLYLNENIKNREERAAETSTFLEEETSRLSKHIAEVETQLAAFKEKNEGRLPELRELNLQLSERNADELLRIEHDSTEATNRLAALQEELSLTSPYSTLPNESGDKPVLQPEDRLKELQAQLADISGTYTEEHPDIRRLKREIASLEAQGYGIGPDPTRDERLSKLKAQLVQLRETHSDDFPDVIRVKREIAAIEKMSNPGAAPAPTKRVRADNPVYLNLRSQIDSQKAELQALNQERGQLLMKQADLQTRLEQTPQVEREYLDLTRDQDNSKARFRELKEKQMDAEVAQQLEHDRKAERFTLIEPPQYPERPASPNRGAILLAGFVLALIGGASTGAVRESLDSTVKLPADLARLLQVPTLGVVPAVQLDSEIRRRKRVRLILLGVGAVVFIVVLILINFLIMPLDVIWYALVRRFFSTAS
jgi:uncharacterized protein involved in exopolysaccharide biosynthesis